MNILTSTSKCLVQIPEHLSYTCSVYNVQEPHYSKGHLVSWFSSGNLMCAWTQNDMTARKALIYESHVSFNFLRKQGFKTISFCVWLFFLSRT